MSRHSFNNYKVDMINNCKNRIGNYRGYFEEITSFSIIGSEIKTNLKARALSESHCSLESSNSLSIVWSDKNVIPKIITEGFIFGHKLRQQRQEMLTHLEMKFLQLAMYRWQVCSSRGNKARSIEQEAVSDTLQQNWALISSPARTRTVPSQ